MSGRPTDPLVWDDGNYAAGSDAWSGTAKRVDPGYRFWTPVLKAAGQFINFFFGNLFDGLGATVKLVGQNPALNWGVVVTDSATLTVNRAAWSEKDQQWWAVGPTAADSALRSLDFGRTWVACTLGSALNCLDVAVDSAGNVSIINSSTRTVYYGTRSAFNTVAFAATATALSASPSGGALTFEATSGNFIACFRVGATGMVVNTSTNGTAWTARTVPAAWSAYTGSNNPAVAAAGGVAIANFYDGTVLRIARSTDGGVTWTEVATPTPSFAPSIVHRATYDEVNGAWYFATGATVPARATEVFKSTDGGVTWSSTVALTTNDWFCNGLVALGALLVTVNDDGRVAWSTDAVSWKHVACNFQSTSGTAALPLGLRAGGGGLLLLNATDQSAWASQRFGDYGQAL